jgi:hypothetical protein
MSEISEHGNGWAKITEARCLEICAHETGERIGWLIECDDDRDRRWLAIATISLRDQLIGFFPTAQAALTGLERNERQLAQVRARRWHFDRERSSDGVA